MSERIFVISAIGKKESDIHKSADAVLNNIIRPAALRASEDGRPIEPIRGDEEPRAGAIMRDIVDKILDCEFVLAVVFPPANPNVFYEIGIAHAAGRQVLFLTHGNYDIPFDVIGLRHVVYDDDDLTDSGHAQREQGPVARLAAMLLAERKRADEHKSQSVEPFDRTDIGPLGRERILERFRNLAPLDWSKILLSARSEIWIAGISLLDLTSTGRFYLPGTDGEFPSAANASLGQLLGYMSGRDVRVTMLMMHPDNPALAGMLTRPLAAASSIEQELEKVREDIDLSFKRWTRLCSASKATAWKVIQVRHGLIPQRITMTEREVVTTPFFCTEPFNSRGPAIRAKAGHPWHSYFRDELECLAARNAPEPI
jgi:hypothetical protein